MAGQTASRYPASASRAVCIPVVIVGVLSAAAALAAQGPPAAKNESVTIVAGPDWLPLDVSLEVEPGSALDFSRIVPRHWPAGKFGRVVATSRGKFAFENCATPSRFYGVDLCCTAQFLPHDLADRLADRLVRLGYNAVRIHHYERDLLDSAPGVIRFKPDQLDQFDYLFAALKRRGIYVTTDLYVSRLIARADVYPGSPRGEPCPAGRWTFENWYNVAPSHFGVQDFKMAVYVNDRAYENFKRFSRALLEHRNPYTKLRYADDPALGWLSLMNEDCPGNFIGSLSGRLREDWQRAWNRWLAARYPDRPSLVRALGDLPDGQDPARGTVPLPDLRARRPGAVALNAFLAEVHGRFFDRTRTFLRDELRCRALLTDANGWTNPVQLQAVRSRFDYVDDHFYVDHPTYLARERVPPTRESNANPIVGGAPGGRACAFTRVFGKPFTITEFNYCGPGQFRGASGILTGALAALQDWDGLWRHVYSYSRESITRPAALSYFDVAADPLTQAAERAGLCLFLRGDMEPAKYAIAIASTPEALLQSATASGDRSPSWSSLAWLARVGWTLGSAPPAAERALAMPFGESDPNPLAPGAERAILKAFGQRGWLPAGNRTDFKLSRIQSETGEVMVDSPQRVFAVDTPRTAGGFAPAGKRIETAAVTIDVLDADATVWVSSLDGEPIRRSKRLLITHLTDLQNSGTRFADRSRQMLLAWGQLPHLVRAGQARIAIRLERPEAAKVYGLAVDGKRLAEIPASAAGGVLSAGLSVSAAGKARMLYEIETR